MNTKNILQAETAVVPPKPIAPCCYQIYEDTEGRHLVLIRDKGPLWIALKVGSTPCLALLSESNLSRMQLIGRATWEK